MAPGVQRCVTLRGPTPGRLTVHCDEAELRAWTAARIVSYWQPWADAVAGNGPEAWAARLRQLSTRRLAASGVLGTARMHATIATGEVISKERAGEYAMKTFDSRWHPIIDDALAYWRGQPAKPGRPPRVLRAETASFVRHVSKLASAA